MHTLTPRLHHSRTDRPIKRTVDSRSTCLVRSDNMPGRITESLAFCWSTFRLRGGGAEVRIGFLASIPGIQVSIPHFTPHLRSEAMSKAEGLTSFNPLFVAGTSKAPTICLSEGCHCPLEQRWRRRQRLDGNEDCTWPVQGQRHWSCQPRRIFRRFANNSTLSTANRAREAKLAV